MNIEIQNSRAAIIAELSALSRGSACPGCRDGSSDGRGHSSCSPYAAIWDEAEKAGIAEAQLTDCGWQWVIVAGNPWARRSTNTITLHISGPRAHEAAADAWAAAAGAHGAYAPAHVARVMTSQEDGEVDLLAAALEGSRLAAAQHDADGGLPCRPRGFDLEVREGRVEALVWASSGSVTLRYHRHERLARLDEWSVTIEVAGRATRNKRVWAALLDSSGWSDLVIVTDEGARLPVAHSDELDCAAAGGIPALEWCGRARIEVPGWGPESTEPCKGDPPSFSVRVDGC